MSSRDQGKNRSDSKSQSVTHKHDKPRKSPPRSYRIADHSEHLTQAPAGSTNQRKDDDSDDDTLRDKLLDDMIEARSRSPQSTTRKEHRSDRVDEHRMDKDERSTRHQRREPRTSGEDYRRDRTPERHDKAGRYRHRNNNRRHRDWSPNNRRRDEWRNRSPRDRQPDREVGGSGVDVSDERPSELPLVQNDPLRHLHGTKRRIAEAAIRVQEQTGIALPKYYNPAEVNPLKYAEQMQKRKLLWQGGKEKKVSSSWQQLLAATSDDKSSEKLRKMIGLKEGDGECAAASTTAALPVSGEEEKRKREEWFRSLDQQYEVARMSTHTHRGVGLGFAAQTQAVLAAEHVRSQQQNEGNSHHAV